jgi:hypothetical protein
VELAVDVNLYALSEVSFLYCEVAKTRVSSEHVCVPSDGPGVLRTHMCCYVVYPICLSNLLHSLLLSPHLLVRTLLTVGTSVLRDFVELPSQLYEHWLSEVPLALVLFVVLFQFC